MKKLILFASLAALIVVGGYWGYTTFMTPPAAAQNIAAPDNTVPAIAAIPTLANPTIVPAQLNKDGIPTQIGTMTLKSSKIGKDALSEFEGLHGSSFDLKTGYRADYVDNTAKATLWVGQAQSADAANTMVKDMGDKIGSGNAMFSNLQTLNISGRTIYEVDGLGQMHFFYAANDKIVWLASDPGYAPDALHSIWGAVK
jgi:hypothetical protein